MRVDCDLLKLSNCLWKLVCVCEPGVDVKAKGNGSSSSCIPLDKRRRVSWLSSSNTIDKVLLCRIDPRGFSMTCVALKLVDSASKAFGFI